MLQMPDAALQILLQLWARSTLVRDRRLLCFRYRAKSSSSSYEFLRRIIATRSQPEGSISAAHGGTARAPDDRPAAVAHAESWSGCHTRGTCTRRAKGPNGGEEAGACPGDGPEEAVHDLWGGLRHREDHRHGRVRALHVSQVFRRVSCGFS